MQQRLKPPPGAARAWVIAAQLFQQFLGAAYHPISTLDACFGREAFATLASDLESSWLRGGSCYARDTSMLVGPEGRASYGQIRQAASRSSR
jgi:hypothetical protein